MIKTQYNLFESITEVDPDIIRTFDETFAEAFDAAEQWALDIETYGGKKQGEALNPFKGKIRLIQIAIQGHPQIGVFDVGLLPPEFFIALIKKMADNSIVVAHNAVFELQWLKQHYGVVGNNIFDTMLASQILYAGIETYKHSLLACLDRELKLQVNKTEQRSDFGLENLTNSQINYSANDVRHLIKLAEVLLKKVKNDNLIDTLQIELAALLPYAYMGLQGFPVDHDALVHCAFLYKDALNVLMAPIREKLGVNSVSTSEELKASLSKYLGTPITETNKVTLSQFTDNVIIQNLLDARAMDNYVGYLERCLEASIDGSVRGNFRQCAPKGLGRATCGSESEDEYSSEGKGKAKKKKSKDGIPGVNLQNPPNPSKSSPTIKALGLPPVRSIFKPKTGQSLLIFDFSAAHARVAAQTTQDKAFIASYNDNVDCHAVIAAELSPLVGKKWTNIDITRIRKQKDQDGELATRLRNTAKNVFYGWVNGAGINKTMMTIHAGGFGHATYEDAERILGRLSKTFPGIKKFHDTTKQNLKKTKPMPGCKIRYARITAISGRKVYIPSFEPSGSNRGGCNPNDAYIANWMMVEADAKKRAMGLIWKKSIRTPEWGLQIANECHDEIDVLCNSEYEEKAAKFCWDAMNGSLAYWVTDLPSYEDEYKLEDCLAESWACK